MNVQGISAVTFAVADMARAVSFYQGCGLEVTYGGPGAEFTSLRAGEAYINLILTPGYAPRWWGRTILRVDNADECHARLRAAGLRPALPQNGEWGERYFHLTDPDGHELSFAQLLAPQPAPAGPGIAPRPEKR
jgi:catechol 2,3-dioxygenase-like lactoylglutathione lyase family enzyme